MKISPINLISRATSWLHLFRLILEDDGTDLETLEKIIICLWGLWNARNTWIFSRKQFNPQKVIESALIRLQSFKSILSPKCCPSMLEEEEGQRWKPPVRNTLKLNTYAVFYSTAARYIYVLRDSARWVLLSGARPLQHCILTELAELLAIQPSVDQIGEYWGKPILIEIDCLNLAQQMEVPDRNFSIYVGG